MRESGMCTRIGNDMKMFYIRQVIPTSSANLLAFRDQGCNVAAIMLNTGRAGYACSQLL